MVEGAEDGLDGGQEMLMPEGIGQEIIRRVIGGDHQSNPALRGCPEQAGNEHAVADVVDVELVKEQHVNIVQDGVHRLLDRRAVA